jgi:hypothetical protein
MNYDDLADRLTKLGEQFAAACNHAGATLRECERLGVPAPRDIWLSTMGPAIGWRKECTLVVYAWLGGVECWEDGAPQLRGAQAAEAAMWIKGRLDG